MPNTDAGRDPLIRHLAEKVCNLQYRAKGMPGDARPLAPWNWNPLDSWADAGVVWEKARKMGLHVVLICSQKEKDWCAWAGKEKIIRSDSGPRALCEAVALATGWKEPQ